MESAGTHLRKLVALAVPATVSQLGLMFLLVVDVLMLGRVSPEALGAAALGRVWLMGTLVLAMGLVFGIDPVAAQAYGRGDRVRLARSLGHGLGLAGLASVPVAICWLFGEPVLRLFGQEAGVAEAAATYIVWQLPGLPAFLGFLVLKQFLQAQGRVGPPVWVALAGNVVNVVANWVLIFGHWGFPALGLTGASISTSLVNIAMFVGLLVWMRVERLPREGWRLVGSAVRETAGVREIAHHGWPIGAQIGLEMWAFQAATLLVGLVGPIELAAHAIAFTILSTVFMVPLGVSIAATIRVGNLIGAGRPDDAQRASWTAFSLGAGIMVVMAAVVYFGREAIPRLFTTDEAVVLAAATVMPIAACFELFDGTQVVGGGILRGMGQTRPAAVFNLVGYFVLALPLGWWLGIERGWGLTGIWWGLALGLGVVATLLVVWVARYGPARTAPWRREVPG